MREQAGPGITEACNGDFGRVFLVTARATYPADPNRWRLWLVPSTARKVNSAIAKLAAPQRATP